MDWSGHIFHSLYCTVYTAEKLSLNKLVLVMHQSGSHDWPVLCHDETSRMHHQKETALFICDHFASQYLDSFSLSLSNQNLTGIKYLIW